MIKEGLLKEYLFKIIIVGKERSKGSWAASFFCFCFLRFGEFQADSFYFPCGAGSSISVERLGSWGWRCGEVEKIEVAVLRKLVKETMR